MTQGRTDTEDGVVDYLGNKTEKEKCNNVDGRQEQSFSPVIDNFERVGLQLYQRNKSMMLFLLPVWIKYISRC